jgi:L-asparaginase II
MGHLPLVELTRGAIGESRHLGSLAVADAQGRLVAAYGDPQAVVYLRSSAKPFQALPLLESGAAAAFGYTPREIAFSCASHQGLDLHAEAAAALQQKIGVSESDLLCGTHPLDDEATAQRLARAGLGPTPNRHNCSGKHTGMLAAAKHLGLPLADYVNPQHPLQQRILRGFAEMCGMRPDEVVVGVDGCSAPNFAVPLRNAALAFARLAQPEAGPAEHAAALRTIFASMTAHPEMVHGPGGFDTELMRARRGVILAKGGAEGYHAIALAPGALGPASPALGVALKVADGSGRASGPAALEVLRQLGALAGPELAALAAFGPRFPLKNWAGREVGELRTCFELVRSP